jgi:catechol 2,3-dioxygenase-like lactoylglutathione lyase family enzyme
MVCNFILYVRDQEASRCFYKEVLGHEPSLDVPGMTEFRLSEKCFLGLMPEVGIKRLLGDTIIDPEKTNGFARAEVYLSVENPETFMERALAAGGRLLSPVESRNWGDVAGYVADPDGHVVAFASRSKPEAVLR